MASVNFEKEEIDYHIVYVGPPASGKQTFVRYMHQQLANPSELIEQRFGRERSISFNWNCWGDLKIEGFHHKLHVHTCSYELDDPHLRLEVLKLADGIAFVADSAPRRTDANIQYRDSIISQLTNYGVELTDGKTVLESKIEKLHGSGSRQIRAMKIPWVIALNKRELTDARSLEDLQRELVIGQVPVLESIAKEGLGIYATLKRLEGKVLDGLHQRKSWWEDLM